MKVPVTMPFLQEVTANRFWIVGDVHGMYDQFVELLWKINDYELKRNETNYVIISVGDICDRGDQSYRTFRYFRQLREAGRFYNVMGNHDEKLLRALTGSKVQPKHGLNITLAEISKWASPKELMEMIEFLQTTPLTVRMKLAPELAELLSVPTGVVAHAAFHDNFHGYSDTPWGKPRTMEYSIYGPVRSVSPEGKPDRIDWENDYDGQYTVFYGHKIIGNVPKFSKKACGVDTGCFQSGILTAVSFPDRITLHVTGNPSSLVVE